MSDPFVLKILRRRGQGGTGNFRAALRHDADPAPWIFGSASCVALLGWLDQWQSFFGCLPNPGNLRAANRSRGRGEGSAG